MEGLFTETSSPSAANAATAAKNVLNTVLTAIRASVFVVADTNSSVTISTCLGAIALGF